MFLTFFCIFIFQLTSKGTNTYLLRLVVPELLLVLTYHLGHNELHLLKKCHLTCKAKYFWTATALDNKLFTQFKKLLQVIQL